MGSAAGSSEAPTGPARVLNVYNDLEFATSGRQSADNGSHVRGSGVAVTATVEATDVGQDVLILGAGFSRAASGRMPLVDELGNACLEADDLHSDPRVPDGGFSGGSFETWLSRLADEQPYQSEPENLGNQALFAQFSAAIADVLGCRVQDVLAGGCPGWLAELVRIAHRRHTTVISFNYDTLVECAVAMGLLYEWGSHSPVSWTEVIGDVPNWPPGPAIWAAEQVDTFQLLKLHGSLNWYWVPRDTSGVSIARRNLPGVFGDPRPYTEEQRQRALPGRVPFVVPPSAVKSAYYGNPIIREIWQQAAARLRAASRVFILGYSLPPADITFAGMLTTALARSQAPVVIVDPAAAQVQRRLHMLGFAEDRVRAFDSGDSPPVEAFVRYWRDDTSSAVLARLHGPAPDSIDDPLIVVWGPEAGGALVTDVQHADGVVTLTTERVGAIYEAMMRIDTAEAPHQTLRDLRDRTRPGDRIEVLTDDGNRQAIVGWSTPIRSTEPIEAMWNMLTPGSPSP